jgi:hypothetical protein
MLHLVSMLLEFHLPYFDRELIRRIGVHGSHWVLDVEVLDRLH